MSLDRGRDLELEGRGHHTIYRRLALALLGLVVLAALLDAFGQESTTSEATGSAATLSVEAPPRLRGGLLFQARFRVHAARPLDEPRLVLGGGWLDDMTLNTVAPGPTDESSSDGTLVLSFPPLAAGKTLTVWTSWQVNPTNVGRHDEPVALLDGSTRIASLDRTVTVFP